MSVDYDANFGIGYEVELMDNAPSDGIDHYVEENIRDEFESFSTGNAYTDEDSRYFITIKNPFKNGLDLSEVKRDLEREISRLHLKVVGGFGCVGGLEVW